MVFAALGPMLEVARVLQRGTRVKRLALLLLPLVGCSALPGGGRSMVAVQPSTPGHHHAQPAFEATHAHAAHASAATRARRQSPVVAAADQLGRIPLTFERAAEPSTTGSSDAQVSDVFVARAARYRVQIAPTWAEIRVPGPKPSTEGAAAVAAAVTMRFEGAAPGPHTATVTKAPGTVSYFIGQDPARWRADLPTYHRVAFSGVYPGIDVAYYGTSREIEYDILVAAGADPDRIALRFEGADGVRIDTSGNLEIAAAREVLTLRAPVAYQEIDGKRSLVSCRYELHDSARVGLRVAAYDPSRPLVIDPILSYAAVLGGGSLDEAMSVKVDAIGNVYLAGTTASTNFPGAAGPSRGIDAFVAKLNSRGVLLYSAYIGGTGIDEARGLAVDPDGNAYVAGATDSTDFPTLTPRQGALGGGTDGFVFKLSTTGAGLLFSTYHGGSSADEATSVAVDNARNVYIAGQTRSANFPLLAQRQLAIQGPLDGFVSRFTPSGSSLLYSTYHGGLGSEAFNGIAVDGVGNAYVTGSTTSTDFPVVGAPAATNSGLADAILSRFTPNGVLTMSTYWGGSGMDVGQAVVDNGIGTAFVVGTTASANVPMIRAMQPTPGGGLDTFILVVTPTNGVYLSTYYGGARSERGRAIAINPAGRLVIVGQTVSSNLPVVRAAQAATGGNRDTFVVQLDSPYTAASYATYLGGSSNDEGMGTAIDAVGRVFVAGAASYPFPVAQGASDAFVYGLSTAADGADSDFDAMPDDWETTYGTDPLTADHHLDPDGDNVPNAQEYANNTHPLGFYTRYLAEGSTGPFFDDRIALFNPSSSMAVVLLRYQRQAPAGEIQQLLPMAPLSRLSINPEILPGLEVQSFSTVVESDQPVVVDRMMTWDSSGFGSHAETSSEAPSTQWFLAEGATGGPFELFYLLQNPTGADADVQVTYLRPAPLPPLVKNYNVTARSRLTINVDVEQFAPTNQRLLSNSDVSAKIASTNGVPILVERAMYMTAQGRSFAAGHDANGVTAPATRWFLAEGATGPFFDLFILLANPNAADTVVEITYLLLNGAPVTRTYDLPANSRRTVWVDQDPQLENVSTSAVVRSTNAEVPIVVERAMWWPGTTGWTEAHDSAGAIVTASRWALAEGEVGGSRSTVTYVLIANTSVADAQVRVTVRYEGSELSEDETYIVPGQSRFTVDLVGEFPNTEGTRFSVLVEGLGTPAPELVVERAMYSNAGNVTWAAGTNAVGTPLFPDGTFTVTANGIFPKVLVVDEGTQIRIVNQDPSAPATIDCALGGHDISDDPHPTHGDYPEFGVGRLDFGQSRFTQNLVDPGSFGVHDHCHGSDKRWQARVIVRPLQ